MRHLSRIVLVALALGEASAAPAAGRSLHWRLLEAEARLDAAGDLHVVERQAMVFTGDWNGGERTFRVAPGQRLRLHRLLRLGDDGVLRELSRGSLDRVDRYAWTGRDGRTLRWRSRLPGDPPFRSRELTYVLEYTISGVLVRGADGGYRLQHDFAFPDRPGPIREVRATLSLDAAWRASGGTLALTRRDLPPGAGAVMTVDLRRVGAPLPPPRGPLLAAPPFPAALRLPLVLAMAAALALAAAWVYRHGRARGQFAALPDVAEGDAPWLREHVLAYAPELVGAVWDGGVGEPEVSAVLARLAAEGKLEAQGVRRFFGLSRGVLLRLRVDRAELRGPERRLVNGLFFDGDTTDTWRLRAHYRRGGFDPASRLSGVRGRARALVRGAPLPRRPWLVFAGLAAAAILLGGLELAYGRGVEGIALPTFPGLALFAFSVVGAGTLANGVRGHLAHAAAVLLPLVLWLAAIAWISWGPVEASVWAVLCDAAVWSAALAFAAIRSRTPLSPEGIALRRRFEVARRYFSRELRRPRPALEDAWIPYLLALGLGRGMDRWIRVHGAGAGQGSWSALGRGGSSAPAWTGGGGRFSGGGATASWAALGGIAAGVSAGSGGSGSSGSSSGGGGGGGW